MKYVRSVSNNADGAIVELDSKLQFNHLGLSESTFTSSTGSVTVNQAAEVNSTTSLITVRVFRFFKGSVIYFFNSVQGTLTLNPKQHHSASHVVHPPAVWMYMLISLIPFLSNNFSWVRVIFINFSVSL